MSEGHAERVTRARVPIVWHETPRAARATVTLTAHGTRRWSQCDRDKNGHPVTGGRTWHGTRPVTVTREITVARPLTLTTSARERARVIGAQTVCRVIPATAIGTVGGVRVPRRKRVSRDRLTRGQVLADAYRRDYAASWRDLRPRARDLRQGYPWVIDPTGERLRLTDEARATLYGPDALASQDRLRAWRLRAGRAARLARGHGRRSARGHAASRAQRGARRSRARIVARGVRSARLARNLGNGRPVTDRAPVARARARDLGPG